MRILIASADASHGLCRLEVQAGQRWQRQRLVVRFSGHRVADE